MQSSWVRTWQTGKKPLKTAWLVTAALMALYFGTARLDEGRGIAAEKGGGPVATQWEPTSLWQQASYERVLDAAQAKASRVAMIGGGVSYAPRHAAMATYLPATQAQAADADRKMVRNSSMEVVTKDPADTADRIRQVGERLGGFLVKSVTNGQDAQGAFLAICVPADRFEEARAEIRKLGVRVDSERVEAQDVTRQYVDLDARLRNLRGEETQYLSIMKSAHTVKDALEVSEKLSDVRGQIEQQQAEFEALSRQVETVAISVSLRTEAEAQVFGLHWRPLYQMKLALRAGLDSLGNYGVTMAGFIFLLPAILLWLITILLGAAFGWRVLRWASRVFFGWPRSVAVVGPAQ